MRFVMQNSKPKEEPGPWTDLEDEARAAHDRGECWDSFWQRMGGHVAATEPFNARRWRRLQTRLWMLVRFGDGGSRDDDPEPWWRDDQQEAGRVLTDEQRRTAAEALRKARETKSVAAAPRRP